MEKKNHLDCCCLNSAVYCTTEGIPFVSERDLQAGSATLVTGSGLFPTRILGSCSVDMHTVSAGLRSYFQHCLHHRLFRDVRCSSLKKDFQENITHNSPAPQTQTSFSPVPPGSWRRTAERRRKKPAGLCSSGNLPASRAAETLIQKKCYFSFHVYRSDIGSPHVERIPSFWRTGWDVSPAQSSTAPSPCRTASSPPRKATSADRRRSKASLWISASSQWWFFINIWKWGGIKAGVPVAPCGHLVLFHI